MYAQHSSSSSLQKCRVCRNTPLFMRELLSTAGGGLLATSDSTEYLFSAWYNRGHEHAKRKEQLLFVVQVYLAYSRASCRIVGQTWRRRKKKRKKHDLARSTKAPKNDTHGLLTTCKQRKDLVVPATLHATPTSRLQKHALGSDVVPSGRFRLYVVTPDEVSSLSSLPIRLSPLRSLILGGDSAQDRALCLWTAAIVKGLAEHPQTFQQRTSQETHVHTQADVARQSSHFFFSPEVTRAPERRQSKAP